MEALVILLVPMVALAIYLISRFQTHGLPQTAQEELAELQQQLAWHEQRLQNARARNWDEGMIAQITSQRDDSRLRLARVSAAAPGEFRQNQAS
jgi:hypothetical protein